MPAMSCIEIKLIVLIVHTGYLVLTALHHPHPRYLAMENDNISTCGNIGSNLGMNISFVDVDYAAGLDASPIIYLLPF